MPRATQDTGRLREATRTGLSPSAAALSSALPLASYLAIARSYNPGRAWTLTVWANPRSLATTGGITDLFSFPAGTKMFQFPAFAPAVNHRG